jgi:hypothetical protein
VVDLEITNFSGAQVGDFDLMFKKNPFGIAIYNATGAFTYP